MTPKRAHQPTSHHRLATLAQGNLNDIMYHFMQLGCHGNAAVVKLSIVTRAFESKVSKHHRRVSKVNAELCRWICAYSSIACMSVRKRGPNFGSVRRAPPRRAHGNPRSLCKLQSVSRIACPEHDTTACGLQSHSVPLPRATCSPATVLFRLEPRLPAVPCRTPSPLSTPACTASLSKHNFRTVPASPCCTLLSLLPALSCGAPQRVRLRVLPSAHVPQQSISMCGLRVGTPHLLRESWPDTVRWQSPTKERQLSP